MADHNGQNEATPKHIFVRDRVSSAKLREIALFESRITGRVNLSVTLHEVIGEAHDRMKASPEYRRWKKQQDQAQAQG